MEGIQLYRHWIASICQIYTQCVNPAPNPPPHCHCHAMYIKGIKGFHKTCSTYIPHNEGLLVGPPSDLQHLKCWDTGLGQGLGRRVGCPGHCGSIRDGGGGALHGNLRGNLCWEGEFRGDGRGMNCSGGGIGVSRDDWGGFVLVGMVGGI